MGKRRKIPAELEQVLKDHEIWLIDHKQGKRANLENSILYNIDLKRVNLTEANLRHAKLCGANLRNAKLSGADMQEAHIDDADLSYADLSGANLEYASMTESNLKEAIFQKSNLSHTDLRWANMHKANLEKANLYAADMRKTNLSDSILTETDLSMTHLERADLTCAYLFETNLKNTSLCGAHLDCAQIYSPKNIDTVIYDSRTAFFAMQCPETGSYRAYKKAGGLIVELEIPEDAERSSATTRSCRANKAKVISITSLDGTVSQQSVPSDYNKKFIYTVGETVKSTRFDKDRWRENTSGIHHFITRREAELYRPLKYGQNFPYGMKIDLSDLTIPGVWGY